MRTIAALFLSFSLLAAQPLQRKLVPFMTINWRRNW